MSTRSFNQYIDMFYKENEEFPDNLQELIRSAFSGPEKVVELQASILEASMNNILISRHPKEANGRSKQHSHDYFELIYVSRGGCIQTIGNTPCNMSEGDICLLNPYVTHNIDIQSEHDILFNIMIKPSLFKDSFLCMITGNDLISNFFTTSLFAEAKHKSFLYFPGAETINALPLAQSMVIELLEKKMGYQKAAENYLALTFTELSRAYQNRIDTENYNITGGTPLSNILSYINQHKQTVTLSSVAEIFHYHPKYLSSLFRKYTGKSFSEIVSEAKMQEVCYYLENTNLTIDELSQLMGYFDRSYFNRTFKKIYHVSPGEYRRSHKNI